MSFEHYPYQKDPFNLSECLEAWAQRGTVSVPATVPGGRKELKILRMIRASSLDDLPIDILITVLPPGNCLPFEFAVVFADQRPEPGKYPLPVIWRSVNGPSPGEWVRPAPRI